MKKCQSCLTVESWVFTFALNGMTARTEYLECFRSQKHHLLRDFRDSGVDLELKL